MERATPDPTTPSTFEAEQAIRRALYEIGLATLTRDAERYKRFSARRTLEFYNFVFNELCQDPKVKEGFQTKGVNSGTDFLGVAFVWARHKVGQIPVDLSQKMARQSAGNHTVSFISDDEALVEGEYGQLRAVFEDGEWKLDSTAPLKVAFLRSQQLPITAEGRQRIEDF